MTTTMTAPNNLVALKQCHKAAESFLKDAQKKFISARNMRALPPTRKRIQDADGIFRDGCRLEKLQRLALLLADQHQAGTISADLAAVTTRAAMERSYYAGPMRALYDQCERAETSAEKVQRLERRLLLDGIPGFFPTPAEHADGLVSLLGPIQPGATMLEPGAGTGALIDAALRVQRDMQIHYFERNYTLHDFLATKYESNPVVYSPGRDFTEVQPAAYGPRYDVILMNPPFENGQDGEHIQLAYKLLAPGGRLAAIFRAGLMVRSDKKAVAFRQFLDDIGAPYVEPLPSGAFKSSGTNTSTYRLCVSA